MLDMAREKSQIIFSLQDLLAESPTTPSFEAHFEVPNNRSSSNYGRTSTSSSNSSLESCSSSTKSTTNLTRTRLSTVVPNPPPFSMRDSIKPLRLPLKSKLFKSKPKKPESTTINNSQPSVKSPRLELEPARPRDPESQCSRDMHAWNITSSPTEEAAPPSIKPYVYSTNKREKNLRGSSCCFCEEPLEHVLAGEKVVALQCNHISHYECLFQMVDMNSDQTENCESFFPFCPTCDGLALPESSSVKHELIRDKLLHQGDAHTAEPVSTNDEALLSPIMTNVPMAMHSPLHMPSGSVTPSSMNSNAFTYVSSTATPGSIMSSPSRSLATPPRKPRQRLPSVAESPLFITTSASLTTPPRNFSRREQPASTAASPGVVVNQNRRRESVASSVKSSSASVPMPEVTIYAEVEDVTPSEHSEQYVNYLISVSVPSDIFSSRHKPTPPELKARELTAARLQTSINNWRLLSFSQFGRLRLHGSLFLSRDMSSWQEVTCYLFETVLLCVRDYSFDLKGEKLGKSAYVKLAVNLSRDLLSSSMDSKSVVHLRLGDDHVSNLYLSSQDFTQLENWHAGLIDRQLFFPLSNKEEPFTPLFLPNSPTSPGGDVARCPVDIVIAISSSNIPSEHKWAAIKETIFSLLGQMGQLDRLGLVVYGSETRIYPLNRRNWEGWKSSVEGLRHFSTGNGELASGLGVALEMLHSRPTSNSSITCIYVISDNSRFVQHPASYEALLSECKDINVNIHSFGVTYNHNPDVLTRSCVDTGGTYFYLREWNQLSECILGRFKADQAYTHRNVEVRLDTSDGVQVTSINGCDSMVNTDVLEGLDGSKPSTRGIKSFQPSNLKNIGLGSLSAGQTRSFLVQASIPPRSVLKNDSQLDVFTVSIAYGGFGDSRITEKQAGTATIKLKNNALPEPPSTPFSDMFSRSDVANGIIFSSSPATPNTSFLGASSDVPPSAIYGNLMYAGDPLLSAPMFLAVQAHNTHVVRRRLQLAVARNLELAVQAMAHDKLDSAVNILKEARPILKGLLEITASSYENRNEDVLYVETKAMAGALDRDIAVIIEKIKKPILFEQDGRKYVIQTIGVLRSQLAFTSRSDIENLFFEKQQEVNII